MSDEQAPESPAAPRDVRGPLVPPEMVPAVEQLARRRPAPLWQSVSVALLVVTLLASLVAGIRWATDRWGDAAQAMTAAEAFKYLASGDADAFLTLVSPEVRPRVSRADILANAQVGRELDWVGPTFSDGAARLVVRRTTKGTELAGPGTAVFTPDPARGDVVLMTSSGGPLGEASGTINLSRTLAGWRVTGYSFTGSREPTGAPAAK